MDETRAAVRVMQDYITEHISEEITIDDLARCSSFSPGYARQLFLKYLGMTPAVYEDYEAAITEIWDAEKKYNPEFIGFKWDDKNPRIQLEPRGERGYIELVPVKKI